MARFDNVVYEEFDSIAKLLRAINERPLNEIYSRKSKKRENQSSHGESRKSFYETNSYDEAVNLLVNGWDKHLEKMREGVEGCNLKSETTTTPRRRPQNNVVGFAPNVPNAILGLPHSMIDIKQQPQKVKTLTLIYNTSVVSTVSADEVLQAGISVLRLVNKIEKDGVKVKLVSEFKSSKEGKDLGIARVVVKDFKDYLDLRKIAFPFANASMQRRIGFAWLETVQGLVDREWAYSYGQSINYGFKYNELTEMLKGYKLMTRDYLNQNRK